ncbi:MAG: hypothetical protein JWP47_3009 [Polaromonas sp.]|nr:hypothetical protein [Polaromonas sp.]
MAWPEVHQRLRRLFGGYGLAYESCYALVVNRTHGDQRKRGLHHEIFDTGKRWLRCRCGRCAGMAKVMAALLATSATTSLAVEALRLPDWPRFAGGRAKLAIRRPHLFGRPERT